MKKIIKKIVPKFLLSFYHFCLAYLGAILAGFPSNKMIVVGITGTKGKTTTANFVCSVLEAGGYKTGLISTANIKISGEETLNHYHMTMPGRFTIHMLMKKFLKAGCKVVILEVTSQGLSQFRHTGINFDVAVFTNLFPEHIESHGNFENYKKAKAILFKTLSKGRRKKLFGRTIEKTIIANADSEHADYFLSFPADQKITFSRKNPSKYKMEEVFEENGLVKFKVDSKTYSIQISGEFNAINALGAVSLGKSFGLGEDIIQQGFDALKYIPGRMEEIKGRDFRIFVDYAHEKESMKLAVGSASLMAKAKNGKTIVLLGAEGGGRDKAKRGEMGKIVGQMADFVVVSNVDPYEDDPLPIAEDIARASEQAGKVRNENLFVILDRKEGIKKALSLGCFGDVVLITGKGAEQSMIEGSRVIPWDDRKVVADLLAEL